MPESIPEFGLDVQWLPTPRFLSTVDPGEREEGDFLCNLAIIIGDRIATANETAAGVARDSICVSALPLARWLCASFWRILYEPGPHSGQSIPHSWRMAHELPAVGEGYAWPEIRFVSDCRAVEIRSVEQSRKEALFQQARYIVSAETRLPVGKLMRVLLEFLHTVAERAKYAENSAFHVDLETLAKEAADRDTAEYNMIEAMLGYDPEEAPDELMDRFCDLSGRVPIAELAELACGLNPVCGIRREDQLRELAGVLQQQGIPARIAFTVPKRPHMAPPWEFGRRLARMVRDILGLGPQNKVSTDELLGLGEVTESAYERMEGSGAVGLCRKDGDRFTIALPTFPTSAAIPAWIRKRFHFARVLGAFLASEKATDWLAISRSNSWVQQVQRNFASEFLAPIVGILEMVGKNPKDMTPKAIEEAAGYFEVSSQTILHSMCNQGKISPDLAGGLLEEVDAMYGRNWSKPHFGM